MLTIAERADRALTALESYQWAHLNMEAAAELVVDLVADHTMTAGEGPWTGKNKPVHPGVLVAGTNCVATDAVGTALMGFDPMADRGTAPFEKCDSTLKLAEQLGLGTRDLKRIEVVGTPIAEARVNFRRV